MAWLLLAILLMLGILGKLFVAAVLLVAAVLVLAMVLNDPVLETDGSCPPGGLYINLVDQFMSKPFTIKNFLPNR